MKIEINSDFKKAFELLENQNKNLFLTGKAGSGKSTFLEYFTKNTSKTYAVLAPTGVAALNVSGETIHSFFKFKPNITKNDVLKKAKYVKKTDPYFYLDILIIDEISMVRADLLDLMDIFLRKVLKTNQAFGGLQILFIGDLYQLPPVVTSKERQFFQSEYQSPYFFDSNVIQDPMLNLKFIELEKIYRQKDQNFIEILNAVRNKTVNDQHLDKLNAKIKMNFESQDYITLTTTNQMANEINNKFLERINSKSFHFQAQINGNFQESSYPTQEDLVLKEGAKVMFLNNDKAGRWVNGTIGKIKKIYSDYLVVQIGDESCEVEPHTWEVQKSFYNQEINQLDKETVGAFTQFPLRLSWAITIHKSQGKTFKKVIIDLGRGSFAHGQTYVALSRCTSLKNLILKKELQKKHLIIDYRIINFLTKFQYQISEKSCSLEDKIKILKQAQEENLPVEITYLKRQDVKSKRQIIINYIGESEYMEKKFIAVEAFCLKRQQDRVFRIDRILDLKIIKKNES